MTQKYDPLPDLARLLRAALVSGRDGAAYADRIAENLGLGEDDSDEMITAALKAAAGLKACRCGIDGGPGLVIPLACEVHGTPCDRCGGLEGCKPGCGAGVVAEGTSWRVVEHDSATRQPKPGGMSSPATVTKVNDLYLVARYKEPGWPGGLVTASFYADSGWAAWDGEYRWRLVPADREDAEGRAPGSTGRKGGPR